MRSIIHGGMYENVSGSPWSRRSRFTHWSAVEDVDVAGAALVGGAGDLARQFLLAEVARDADQLARLHVRAEADDQVGEPAGQVGVVAHRAGD